MAKGEVWDNSMVLAQDVGVHLKSLGMGELASRPTDPSTLANTASESNQGLQLWTSYQHAYDTKFDIYQVLQQHCISVNISV